MKEYPLVEKIPVTNKRIVELVRDDAEDKKYILNTNIEIVVPAATNLEILKNITKDGASISVNKKKYYLYNDFYSFKGIPYTDEASIYLGTFNKFEVKVDEYKGIVFSIWYRNIPE